MTTTIDITKSDYTVLLMNSTHNEQGDLVNTLRVVETRASISELVDTKEHFTLDTDSVATMVAYKAICDIYDTSQYRIGGCDVDDSVFIYIDNLNDQAWHRTYKVVGAYRSAEARDVIFSLLESEKVDIFDFSQTKA